MEATDISDGISKVLSKLQVTEKYPQSVADGSSESTVKVSEITQASD